MSVVDNSTSAVVEGTLEIGRVFGMQSKITPVTSTGRWSGKHRVELTNWGNSPVRLRLVTTDPDEKLGFLVTPDAVDVPLGGTARAKVKVRTRKPFMRGTPVRIPFQVIGEPDPPAPPQVGPAGVIPDTRRQVMDGVLVQKPILTRVVVLVAGLLLLALIAGIVWALTHRDSGDDDELAADASAPAQPTGLHEAKPFDEGTVTLGWEPPERDPDTYELHSADAETGESLSTLIPEVPGADQQVAVKISSRTASTASS